MSYLIMMHLTALLYFSIVSKTLGQLITNNSFMWSLKDVNEKIIRMSAYDVRLPVTLYLFTVADKILRAPSYGKVPLDFCTHKEGAHPTR